MKAFTGFLKDVWRKVKHTLGYIYANGVGDLVSGRRFYKSFIDCTLIFAWWIGLTVFGNSVYTSIIGVALIMSVLSRMFTVEGRTFFGDLINPFITMVLYALSAFLFFWSFETALIAGALIIPNATNEVYIKYNEYMECMEHELQSL